MSLKALAEEVLARLHAGETPYETKKETDVKQMKQADPCFIGEPGHFAAMKQDIAQFSAENGPCFTVSPSRHETHETSSLPDALIRGLEALTRMVPPRITKPEVWPVVVADALRLADDGWAAQALGLGWGPVDIWGCSPDVGGNPDHDGLAVWLAGRRVLLLDERTCIVETGPVARSVFTRRKVPPAGAVLLWDLGKGARRGGS